MNRRNVALTAAEMIVALEALDPDTVIYDVDYDDFSIGYDSLLRGFAGVTDNGCLQHGKVLDVYDSWERNE